MDKTKLNNEIVLCRHAVRKARVLLIRKILKKMKILKSCKNESLKEKKLKKSERLFKKIQIMKRVKDDDVTKFALKHRDLDKLLKDNPKSLKNIALASLSRHDAVVKKIVHIRSLITNWETELPLLLESIEKEKRKKKNKLKKKNENDTPEEKKKKEEKVESNGQISTEETDESKAKSPKKLDCKKLVKKKKVEKKDLEEKSDNKNSKQNGISLENNDSKADGAVVSSDEENSDSVVEHSDWEILRIQEKHRKETKKRKRSKVEDNEESDSADIDETKPIVTEKIDDPFFIEKKVIAPKLLLENLNEKTEKPNSRFQDDKYNSRNKFQKNKPNFQSDLHIQMFQRRPFKAKNDSSFVASNPPKPPAEELHPSWAAKKAANLLIKPFQGKKIKFDDD